MEYKAHVNLSIRQDVVEKAKELGINMSALLEKSINEKSGVKEVNIPIEDGGRCDKCGRVERQATADNTKGLCWLCPDEIWVCDSCLHAEMRKIIIAA